MFEVDTAFSGVPITKVTVVGVGGGGINAVNHMISKKINGLNFVEVDTDENAISNSQAPICIKIDEKSPQEIQHEILKSLAYSDIVFIVAGMGGYTGTKLESIFANYAKGLDALTISLVTLPLAVENLKERAANGINKLRQCADSIILVFNDSVANLVEEKNSTRKIFNAANEILTEIICGITDLLYVPGVINLERADINNFFSSSGYAFVGIGEAGGENAFIQAVQNALNSPIFEKGVQGAHSILICFNGSNDSFTMAEINEASTLIMKNADRNAEIIWGTSANENFGNKVRVTILATRFYK